MQFLDKNISYIAKTNFRNQNQIFGIKPSDRLLHTFVLGKTGTGKTTLLKNLFLQDMRNRNGCAFLDPHGDVVEEIFKIGSGCEQEKRSFSCDDLIYLNCTYTNCIYGFNPLKKVSINKRPLVASGLLEIFEKLFSKKA